MSNNNGAQNNKIDARVLASLARISLTDEEAEKISTDFPNMAEYTYSLLEKGEDSLPFSYEYLYDHEPRLRDDTPRESELADEILANAASKDGRYISVPCVIKEDEI